MSISDPYQGSSLSKLFGFLSFTLAISAGVALLFLAWKIAAVTFLGAIVCGYFGYRLAGGRTSPAVVDHRLLEWARSIPLSEAQRKVMQELWTAAKNNSPPTSDPPRILSPEELAGVKRVSRADFRPKEFGHRFSNELRYARFLSLKESGFSDEHAAIITGMTFNMVGNPELDAQ